MKYKLIKEYPGSPPLGSIVESKCTSSSLFYLINDKIVIPKEHVENNPEYWEKFSGNPLVSTTARSLIIKMGETGIDYYDSIKCAIVAVNELIQCSKEYDSYHATESSQSNFWTEVKKELERWM